METVNVHEAKTNLSRLIDKAAKGEPFVIAKSGRPMVRVEAVENPAPKRRVGFLEGTFAVPEEFDRMFAGEIREMFEGAR